MTSKWIVLLLLASAQAFAAGSSSRQLQAASIKNGSGTLSVNSSGTVTLPNSTGTAALTTDLLTSPLSLQNCGLSSSVGSSALTISLKQADGSTDPSSGNSACKVAFPANDGSYNVRSSTAATSLVISSGSTLGHTSAKDAYIYVYALDNSGTIELAASSKLFDEGTLTSTTAEGGAGAADSATAIYSTTARTTKPIRLIGRLFSNQSTAGTWASNTTTRATGFFTKVVGTYWSVNANITDSGGNVDLGTSDQSTYTGIESGTMTLANNTTLGLNVLTASIPCSGTNSATGTTCAAGNESIGITFTAPTPAPPGGWETDVCVSFSHDIGNGASGNVAAAFEIVETPNNAQTITAEGAERQASTISTASTRATFPHRICSVFILAPGTHTFRLFYEQDVTATVNVNTVVTDGAATVGQRDVHWTARPLNAGVL